jgi:preprotein translocase subunit SecG
MEHLFLVIHVVIAAALIGAVLIQRSDSDGFGLGSGSGANFMTGRATANLLTRTTAILATLFIISSLALSILAARGGEESIADTIAAEDESEPSVPLAVEKNDESGAVAPALDRDAAVDTDKAAKKASAEKAKKPAASKKAPVTDASDAAQDDAPSVPTAE